MGIFHPWSWNVQLLALLPHTADDDRPVWICYGSSITHGGPSGSSASNRQRPASLSSIGSRSYIDRCESHWQGIDIMRISHHADGKMCVWERESRGSSRWKLVVLTGADRYASPCQLYIYMHSGWELLSLFTWDAVVKPLWHACCPAFVALSLSHSTWAGALESQFWCSFTFTPARPPATVGQRCWRGQPISSSSTWASGAPLGGFHEHPRSIGVASGTFGAANTTWPRDFGRYVTTQQFT